MNKKIMKKVIQGIVLLLMSVGFSSCNESYGGGYNFQEIENQEIETMENDHVLIKRAEEPEPHGDDYPTGGVWSYETIIIYSNEQLDGYYIKFFAAGWGTVLIPLSTLYCCPFGGDEDQYNCYCAVTPNMEECLPSNWDATAFLYTSFVLYDNNQVKTNREYVYEYWSDDCKLFEYDNFNNEFIPNISAEYSDEIEEWFGDYFLQELNCSGNGNNNDKNMIESTFPDIEDYYNQLPEKYRSAITTGTDDTNSSLYRALERYDYCVFYKGYNVNDFLERGSRNDRFYTATRRTQLFLYKENSVSILVIIACSLMALSSLTVLTILLVKKRHDHV